MKSAVSNSKINFEQNVIRSIFVTVYLSPPRQLKLDISLEKIWTFKKCA